MKKIFYTVILSSAVILTSCFSEDKGTSTEVVDNDEAEVNPNTINDYEQPGTVGSPSSTAYTDEVYQQHAQFTSDEIAKDLQLDEATAVELVKIYYKRNKKLGNIEQGNADTTTMQAGDRAGVDKATDEEMKAILTPEQYKKYLENRDRYNRQRENEAGREVVDDTNN